MQDSPSRRSQVEALVRLARTRRAHSELEVRLGTHSGTFDPNVGRGLFERLRTALELSEFVQTRTREAMHDYFFDSGGRRLRTRVHFDSRNMVCSVCTVAKAPVDQVLLPPAGSKQRHSLRIQLSSEEPCADVPRAVTPVHVRIVSRFSYVVGAWRYDLSVVASGDSRREAERSLRERNFAYLVECELMDGSYLDSRSDAYVAESIVLKMASLCTTMHWDLGGSE